MFTIKWSGILAAIFSVFLIAGIALCCLDDNEYQKYQLLDHTIHKRVRWIYERINYDKTLVDVALVGSSRMLYGINAPQLQAELSDDKHTTHVANFSELVEGSDLHWDIVNLLFKHKAPSLIILGVTETPPRTGHEIHKYIASRSEIIYPGYITNISYLPNIIYLPYRQLYLFAARLFPSVFAMDTAFSFKKYAGTSPETIQSRSSFMLSLEARFPDRASRDLQTNTRKLKRVQAYPLFGKEFANIEFMGDRLYVGKIARLAKVNHAHVIFLFIPYYRSNGYIADRSFYLRYGEVVDASFLASRGDLFNPSDPRHLNRNGAIILTRWLSDELSKRRNTYGTAATAKPTQQLLRRDRRQADPPID